MLIDPPILNPEIKNKREEVVLNRDKRIELKQKKNTAFLTAVSKGLSLMIAQGEVIDKLLLNKVENDPDFELLSRLKKESLEVIECFGNAGRLVVDLQHDESMVRRSLILANLPNVSETIKETIKNTSIDKFLFGSELMEKIKAARQLEQSADSDSGKPRNSQKTFSKNSRIPLRGQAKQYQGTQSGQKHLLGASGRNKTQTSHLARRRSPQQNYHRSRKSNHHSRRR